MLEVKDISFIAGNTPLLQHIDFRANVGEFIAILGANGAGKSTLIKIVGGQLKPTNGNILWNQQPVLETCKIKLARERAVLTQQTLVAFEFSVADTVMMGRYPHFKSQAQNSDYEIVQQHLINTDLLDFSERNIQTLSGGEQQRAHIARVLSQVSDENLNNSNSNKLLLLDEPLNNLDIKHQHKILQLASEFARKDNVVLAVLHDINLAALYADKILLLKKGAFVALGTPEEVLTDELISLCYDYPATITQHPFHNIPQVHFGCPVNSNFI